MIDYFYSLETLVEQAGFDQGPKEHLRVLITLEALANEENQ